MMNIFSFLDSASADCVKKEKARSMLKDAIPTRFVLFIFPSSDRSLF
jgi:hypothetical protein